MILPENLRQVFIVLCMVFLAGPVAADEGTTIAIIDLERVRQESSAGKSIESQIFGYRQELAEEVNVVEGEIRERLRSLKEQETLLTQEGYEKIRQEIEQHSVTYQTRFQNRRRNLDAAYLEAMEQLHSGILEVLGKLIFERHIDVVLDRRQYLVANSSFDISDDVLRELDTILTGIPVVPAPEG
ncbi:MAG: OmpH family outer membrane protein [Alphaproteobacteria bacterium]|nr:OmpH family outer membrane protein [Alphaproteobacteria bacterium]